MVNGSSNYFVNLDHEYQFKGYCKGKSIEVFNSCLAQGIYPSRLHLIILGASEILYAPFTLIKKVYEIFVYVWNLINLNKFEPRSLKLSKTFSLIALQSLIPLASLVIRLSSVFLGIFKPRFALVGWKLAEEVEKLSYEIWAEDIKQYDWKSNSKQVCEAIIPANAIHYLGFEQTRFHLKIDPKKLGNIENQINHHFANLLNYVFEKNHEYFQKLLCPLKVVEQGNYGYILSPDIAKILLRLSQMRQEGDSDIILIQLIFKKSLTFNEIHRLFTHIDLNLQSRIKELNLDTHIINLHLTHLKDLFSLHFEFGRAHFHLENHNILPYSRI